MFNPIDPNPAIAAHAVFPQSVRSRPEKRPFFHIFPHFPKIEPSKKYLPHIGVQYNKLKPMKFPFQYKINYIILINRCGVVGFLIWILALTFGDILREFGEILGKYRMLNRRSMGSKGLRYHPILFTYECTMNSDHFLLLAGR